MTTGVAGLAAVPETSGAKPTTVPAMGRCGPADPQFTFDCRPERQTVVSKERRRSAWPWLTAR